MSNVRRPCRTCKHERVLAQEHPCNECINGSEYEYEYVKSSESSNHHNITVILTGPYGTTTIEHEPQDDEDAKQARLRVLHALYGGK